MCENSTYPDKLSDRSLTQPSREEPLLPKKWLHRYFRIRLTSNNGQSSTSIPCSSSHLFIGDLNPRWYVDKLIETNGGTLFTLYLETTDACADRCKMCFTAEMRKKRGFKASLNMELALERAKQLRERYPTLKSVCLVGPGEPLEYRSFSEISPAIADMGLSIRVYTSGKRLSDDKVRKAVISNVNVLRISLDAANPTTFQKTHGARDFRKRVEAIRRLVEGRESTNGVLSIGLHFVIQKDNFNEIIDFVSLAKKLHVDFVVFTQATYAKVLGGLSKEEYQKVQRSLDYVRNLHDEEMAVVVPQVVRRHTYVDWDTDYFASPELLNECYNSRHKIYFGVQNDYSACWLAAMGQHWEHFREQACAGRLRDDEVLYTICRIIDNGLGSFLAKGAYLACNSCLAENYNALARSILSFSKDKSGVDTELIQYSPDSRGNDFEIVFGAAK